MVSEVRLPVLVSIPHGGLQIPPEVKKMCRLRATDILRDGDTWSRYLYDLESSAYVCHSFPVARAVVDVNRAPDELPPEYADGVVKTFTVDYRPVWKKPSGLPPGLTEVLLENYYYPYHDYLEAVAHNRHIILGLDCHTMLDREPRLKGGGESGRKRPLVCLSNRGGKDGEELDEPVTAPPGLLRGLAEILERRMKDIISEWEGPAVSLNDPFRGGYIIKKHGHEGYIPWIQVEFNRSLYLLNSPRRITPSREALWRINKLRDCFSGSLEELFSPGRVF